MRTSDSEVSASAKTSARYRYSGPTSGVTLQEGEDVREVMLHTGAEVELPVEHEYTKTLLALQYLTPVDDKGKQAKPPARSGADETLQTKGA
ncbi:hypothetical protein VI26_15960 [Chromobacterium sp. LK1]|uniref:hypothetical protein n=1 Tax=Chromobacterium sp. LK1 TaxID=1628193 RepID=UPI00065412BF|nr:hypothetical protein [Chromobacterium sp. LK1]KMN33076.1 hypothetical protein VI26_15960 [Chromobacterium sp. LK1]